MKKNCEKQVVDNLAMELMVAARTAPKSRGIDSLELGLMEPGDKDKLLVEMDILHQKTGRLLFSRDAQNLRDADGCVFFGVVSQPLGLDCGACGFTCEELLNKGALPGEDYNGPVCAFKILDLGIAIGSACRRAMELSLDNRVMYSLGLAAKRAGLIGGDVVMALPISINGKNIFFDRQK